MPLYLNQPNEEDGLGRVKLSSSLQSALAALAGAGIATLSMLAKGIAISTTEVLVIAGTSLLAVPAAIFAVRNLKAIIGSFRRVARRFTFRLQAMRRLKSGKKSLITKPPGYTAYTMMRLLLSRHDIEHIAKNWYSDFHIDYIDALHKGRRGRAIWIRWLYHFQLMTIGLEKVACFVKDVASPLIGPFSGGD